MRAIVESSDTFFNAYIAWAAKEVKARHGVDVRHVKITDAAEVVKRLQTELAAGKRTDGSVDLMWVNGENFRNLKNANALYGPWATQLPSWALVDTTKPVQSDFSVPTDGLESPWGTAQLTFLADRATTATPPRSAAEWLAFARANPGRTSYPKPPDFHGTTFVKQLLLELTPDRAALQQPVTVAAFAKATAPLPVPKSRMRQLGVFGAWGAGRVAKAHSTRVSVSGRGSSTRASTVSVKPKKSLRPVM